MSKFYSVLLAGVFMFPAICAMADNGQDIVEEATSSLKANLNRIALQYNQNSVTNKDEEDNYPGTFSSDEQEVFTGIFDGNGYTIKGLTIEPIIWFGLTVCLWNMARAKPQKTAKQPKVKMPIKFCLRQILPKKCGSLKKV